MINGETAPSSLTVARGEHSPMAPFPAQLEGGKRAIATIRQALQPDRPSSINGTEYNDNAPFPKGDKKRDGAGDVVFSEVVPTPRAWLDG